RLIWRFAASPTEAGAPPAPALVHAVQVDDGDTFWVAAAERLLGDVPEPRVEEDERAGDAEPVLPELSDEDVEPLDAPVVEEVEAASEAAAPAEPPAAAAPPPAPAAPPPAATAAMPPAAAAAPPPAETVAPPPAPAAAAAPPRRALVADDALMARHFLARLLEGEGFEVQAVSTA